MKKIFSFLKNNKHFFLLLYAAIYIPWFGYVEKKVNIHSDYHIIHMALDDYIPFCEFFVIPYYLWFVYIAVTILYIAFRDGKTCWRMGAFLITGMTLFLIISTVYPNGHQLRPDAFARDNFCVDLVQKLYATDTPTNLFPSIHVYNSIGAHLALTHCDRLMNNPRTRWVKWVSLCLMVSIILSTMFLKQHSVFDVITALALAAVMYVLCYGPAARVIEKSLQKQAQRTRKEFPAR